MLQSSDPFLAIPAGSLAGIDDENKITPYVQAVHRLKGSVFTTATSMKTGAFIRGMLRQHGIAVEQAPIVAFTVLKILLGETQLAQLAGLLSSDLGIANDKAQKIAQEIERDIFAPISLELNRYLSTQRQKGSITSTPAAQPSTPSQQTSGARFPRTPATPSNVLNLKNSKKPPSPPPIPRKEDSAIF